MNASISLHTRCGSSFKSGFWPVSWLIALGIALTLGPVLAASAQSNDALAQGADKQLSETQKLMFDGKKDEAVEALLKAAKDIEQLRAAAPEHARLRSLDSKAERLKRDLERRTGKTIDLKSGVTKDKEASATPPAPPAPAKTEARPKRDAAKPAVAEAPKAGGTGRLPAPAQQAMRELENKFRSIENCYQWLETYRKSNEDPAKMEAKLKSAGALIGELQPALNTAKQESSSRGVTSHPDFDAAQKRIDEQPARLEKTLAEVKQLAAGAATSKGEVQADVGALATAFEGLREKVFHKAPGVAIYFNDLKPVGELIALIEGFEKKNQAVAKETLAKFAAKYGQTSDAIDKKAGSMGYAGNQRAGYIYEEMKKGIENVAKTRNAMAEELVKRAEKQLDALTTGHDFYRIKHHSVIREFVTMAKRFDVGNARVQEMSGSVEKRLAADMKVMGAKIDGVKWPGSVSSKKKEEAAGLRFFKESPDWEKRSTEPRRILGIAIKGEWTIQERNLLGQPVMYGIAALVAVQVEDEKKENLARVYNVTLRTAESATAKPEAPFAEITVGDSWYIRPGAVK